MPGTLISKSTMASKPPGSSFKPRNNLNAGHSLARMGPPSNSILYGNSSKRPVKRDGSRGFPNLRRIPLGTFGRLEHSQRGAKRRKVSDEVSTLSTGQIEISDDDSGSQSPGSTILVGQPSSTRVDKTSSSDFESDRFSKNSSTQREPLFQKLPDIENKMTALDAKRKAPLSPNHTTISQRKGTGDYSRPTQKSTGTKINGLSSVNAIEVMDDDAPRPHSCTDTDNGVIVVGSLPTTSGEAVDESAERAGREMDLQEPIQSPYFAKPVFGIAHASENSATHDRRERKRKFEDSSRGPHGREQKIQQGIFRARVLERSATPESQELAHNMSPDELERDNTSNSTSKAHAQVPQSSVHRQETRKLRSISPRKNPIGKRNSLPSSVGDIKPIAYRRSGRKQNDELFGRSKKSAQHETAYQQFVIQRLIVGDLDLQTPPSFTLLFDQQSNEFHVYDEDSDLTSQHLEFAVRPKKISKIYYGANVIEIVNHRTASGDNTVGIELVDEEAVLALLKEIKQSDPSIVSVQRSSDHMANFLSRRAALTSLQAGDPKGDLDLRRIINRRARRKSDKGGNDHQKTNSTRCQNSLIRKSPGSDDHLRPRASSHIHNYLRETSPIATDPIVGDKHIQRAPLPSASRVRAMPDHIDDTFKHRDSSPFPKRSEPIKYSIMPGLGRKWIEPLVYPQSGQRRTTVDFSDLERLDEGEFLNDNIISFYLRYLEDQMELPQSDAGKRVYIFNTFFYERLTDTGRGKRGINYEAVQKWTSKVDIFNFDFVVVPINESAHWYVAIICNLPNLAGRVVSDRGEPSASLVEDDHCPSGLNPDTGTQSVEHDSSVVAEVEGDKIPASDVHVDATEGGIARLSLSWSEVSAAHTPSPNKTSVHQSRSPDSIVSDKNSGVASEEARIQRSPSAESLPLRRLLSPTNASPHAKSAPNKRTGEEIESPEFRNAPLKSSSKSRKNKRKSLGPQRKYNTEEPIIITLDSLGLPHSSTVKNLKDYLSFEGKGKRDVDIDTKKISGMTAKQIPLQDNYCDCGLYLLGYVEKFLEAPRILVNKLLRREIDEERDWPQLKPSAVRDTLREIIMRLGGEQDRLNRAKRRDVVKKRVEENANAQKRTDAPKEVSAKTQLSGHQAVVEKPEGEAKPEVKNMHFNERPTSGLTEASSESLRTLGRPSEVEDQKEDSVVFTEERPVEKNELSEARPHHSKQSRHEQVIDGTSLSPLSLQNSIELRRVDLAARKLSSSSPVRLTGIQVPSSPERLLDAEGQQRSPNKEATYTNHPNAKYQSNDIPTQSVSVVIGGPEDSQ
ncbi:MAG: hypothetical protein M1837_001464 [Sclerophora amabilis]|nr:MAG: hypothetical protein M1837_001464 [Sclerophora amabilis]